MVFKLPKPKRRVNEKMTLEALHKSAETYKELYEDIRKKNDILQKQLDIAVKCLNTYANEDYWLYCCKACGGSYYTLHKDKINLKYGEYPARDALANIKDLNK